MPTQSCAQRPQLCHVVETLGLQVCQAVLASPGSPDRRAIMTLCASSVMQSASEYSPRNAQHLPVQACTCERKCKVYLS